MLLLVMLCYSCSLTKKKPKGTKGKGEEEGKPGKEIVFRLIGVRAPSPYSPGSSLIKWEKRRRGFASNLGEARGDHGKHT
jgi:hypothetical protein